MANYYKYYKNHQIIIRVYPNIIRNSDGSLFRASDAGHAMTVTGCIGGDKFVVSSWNGKYYVYLSDYTKEKLEEHNIKDREGNSINISKSYIRLEIYRYS